MKEPEILLIAEYIDEALKNKDNNTRLEEIKQRVVKLCGNFPIYEDLV
ncbi:MAG: hypothetical protein M1332_04755 [Deltaproteobacteria bacterium]|nr:hypothetical protein [Deltaproteobacteria bacterium]